MSVNVCLSFPRNESRDLYIIIYNIFSIIDMQSELAIISLAIVYHTSSNESVCLRIPNRCI